MAITELSGLIFFKLIEFVQFEKKLKKRIFKVNREDSGIRNKKERFIIYIWKIRHMNN